MFDSITLILVFMAFLVLGRFFYHRNLEKLSMVIVGILVFTIGVWSGKSLSSNIFLIIFSAVLYLFCLFTITLISGIIIHRSFSLSSRKRSGFSITILFMVLLGWITSFFIPEHFSIFLSMLIRLELYVLIALIALSVSRYFTKETIFSNGREAVKAVSESFLNGLFTGLVFWFITGTDLRVSIAIAWGMGWYSFTGPFIGLQAGPIMGMLAFLVNLLREQLTFLVVPLIKEPRLSLLSIGGATTMDNTLPVYSMVYGKEFSMTALIHGAIHTLLVPLILTIIFTI